MGGSVGVCDGFDDSRYLARDAASAALLFIESRRPLKNRI